MEYRIIRIRIIRRRRELDGDRIMCRGNAGENRVEKESDSSRSRGCKENGGDRRSDEIREWKRKKREKGGLTVDLRFSEANYCHGEGDRG